MPDIPSVESRLIRLLAMIAGTAVIGVLAILPYRLYQRDIRTAEVNAHRIASVVHASLSRAARNGEDLAEIVNSVQGIAATEITLQRVDEGEVHPAATFRAGSSVLRGTDLTYYAPPIFDRDGKTMIASMYFDLAPMKRSSVYLIIGLVIAVIGGSIVFSVAVFYLIRHSLVLPLQEAIERYEAAGSAGGSLDLPPSRSREVNDLVRAVSKACEIAHERA
jgi:methyl-accepting chemotaxis protein